MLLAKYYMHVYVNPDLFHLAGATASDPCQHEHAGRCSMFSAIHDLAEKR